MQVYFTDVLNDTVIIDPNNHLVYGVNHYVTIDVGAFRDAANDVNYSGIDNNTTWNFHINGQSGPCGCAAADNCDLSAPLQAVQ